MPWWNAVAAGVSGLLGMGSSLIQQNQNNKMMNKQMAYNTSEREASQSYQTGERQSMQDYQTSEREAQNAYNERVYNNYQSPAAMVRQFKEAGLNPLLAIDSSGVGSVGASSGSNGGAPSSSSPHGAMPSAPYQNISAMSNGFQNIAQSMLAIAQAKKAGVETSRLEKFTQEELRGIELSNNAQELLNSVNEKYLDKQNAQLLKNTIQQYSLGTIKAEEMRSQLELLAKENLIKQKTVDHWDETYRNAQENIKADTEVKYSTTMVNDSIKTLNESKVLTESTVRSLNRSLSRLNAALSSSAEIQALIDSDTYEAKTIKEYNVSKAEAEKALRDFYQFRSELEQIAEHNINDDDWQALEYLLNWTFNGIRRLSRSVQGKSAFD